jgi:hypothetical protein
MMTKDNNTESGRTFNSLTDIRAYKEELRLQIEQNEDEISHLWGTLFHPEEPETKTRVQKWVYMFNVGSSMFDGVMLGWKLYRKFGGEKNLSIFGRHRRHKQ